MDLLNGRSEYSISDSPWLSKSGYEPYRPVKAEIKRALPLGCENPGFPQVVRPCNRVHLQYSLHVSSPNIQSIGSSFEPNLRSIPAPAGEPNQ